MDRPMKEGREEVKKKGAGDADRKRILVYDDGEVLGDNAMNEYRSESSI